MPIRSFYRFLVTFWCVTACLVTVQAQNAANLKHLLARNGAYDRVDTGKVRLLLNIVKEYKFINADSTLAYANAALQLSQQLNAPVLIGESWNALSFGYQNKGDNRQALHCTEQALPFLRRPGAEVPLYSTLINLGMYLFRLQQVQQARDTLEMALVQVQRLNNLPLQLSAQGNLAIVYAGQGEMDLAKEKYRSAIDLSIALGDRAAQGRNLLNLGGLYYRTDNLVTALDYMLQGLAISESMGNKRSLAISSNDIANVYSGLGDYEKAIFYAQKAMTLFQEMGDKRGIALSTGNLAQQYELLKQYDKALELQQRSIALKQQLGIATGRGYNSLGNLYYYLEQYDLAFDNYKIGLQQNTLANDPIIAQYLWCSMADCVLHAPEPALIRAGFPAASRLDTTLVFIQRGLDMADKINNTYLQSGCWRVLSEVYERQGDYIKAYDAYKKHISYRDSLNGETVKKQTTRREIQYEFDKKEAALQFEQKLTKEQLEQQRLLAIEQQQALQLKEQALSLSNREKELQRLAYLKERAEKQEKEQQLALAEKDKQLQAADLIALTREKALQLQTLARQNALIGFLIAGLVALLLAALSFYFWQRQRQASRETMAQQQFTHQLFESTEEERSRIARDLHDGVSHELLALRHELKGTDATQRIDRIIDDIRQISRNLHPVMLDSIGLQLSLETLCNQYMEQGELFISHEINYPRRLPANAELQVFRIVQEALSNAIKYAHANAVQVRLSQEGPALHLLIQDNGRGFDVQQALQSGKAFGLHSIFQRSKAIGAQASIQSSASGTVVKVTL